MSSMADRMRRGQAKRGFTLAELLLGTAVLAVALAALLGAFLGQSMLNEHARNLTWAINDANRVMERLRQQNTGAGCTAAPNASATLAGYPSWDAWLAAGNGGGGKSIQNGDERIFVTCRDNASRNYCGDVNQIGTGEWNRQIGVNTNYDPIQVSVAVCWRHRQRVIGECTWNAGTQTLNASDTDGDGVIESPGMLSTVITCRR